MVRFEFTCFTMLSASFSIKRNATSGGDIYQHTSNLSTRVVSNAIEGEEYVELVATTVGILRAKKRKGLKTMS